MLKPTKFILLVLFAAALVTVIGILGLGKIEEQQIEVWLSATGMWAPLLYVLLYTLGTLFLLPSTPLNLAGGAIFGTLQGTFWTTVAAVIAALVAFAFTRTIGREFVLKKMSKKWLKFDQKIEKGGLLYIFSIRLIPIIPYGIVNFIAGLTAIRLRDYFFGTLFGTVFGVFPFVMMGASLQTLSEGNYIHFTIATGLVGVFLLGVNFFQKRKK